MSKPKLSPWFNAKTQPPVRPGWYDAQWGDVTRICRMRWDGKRWRGNAFAEFGMIFGDRWRGVLK